ncbi:class I SAM-dependent methyltransferase [Aliarcobacter cryaerophilus]|uniref:class I SAM-dependent methyltransferase n=1 Tax=Aliarcobacter cryaerophilus TaxID=28198 RepID=UPI0021B3DC46|nr:class I SAM-dependent methyltransferase [Aliarcobacter cryaerophilus]MCT7527178.1 class I SAM-dependent methyltransferase [Aliarcobacter cryaerophilus]
MKKNINVPQSYEEYMDKWTKIYQNTNYDSGLTGYFLKKSHEWSEKKFDKTMKFNKVLEVGAGSGVHIDYVKHQYDEYYMTDLHDSFINQSKDKVNDKVILKIEDATKLSFEDNTFDRVIATHILEHVQNPHEVLMEWTRVLKPGGVLTIVLPCDPGFAWRLGRYCCARKSFIKQGIDYDYWMAREHINPINNLVSFVKTYFNKTEESWKPFSIPSIDLNLFYIVHIKI